MDRLQSTISVSSEAFRRHDAHNRRLVAELRARQEAAREANGATDVETEWELELSADGIADPAWLTVVRRG